jgi:HSP20 family protein
LVTFFKQKKLITKKDKTMTMVKVNNRPAFRTFNGLVNELFNDLENTLAPNAGNAVRNLPAVNIIETNEGYHAELLAPGRKKENFSLGIEKNQLTVAYNEEKAEGQPEWKQIRKEFTLGNFKRTFNLDENIDSDNIQAKYEDGLLKLFLPKKAELKPVARNIEVQ